MWRMLGLFGGITLGWWALLWLVLPVSWQRISPSAILMLHLAPPMLLSVGIKLWAHLKETRAKAEALRQEEAARQRLFLGGVDKGLQLAGVVARPEKHEGLAGGLEGMQVEQRVVLGQQRAQPVGDMVLVVLRRGCRGEVAVQIALAAAPAQLVSQRVGHRHQGQPAGGKRQRALLQLRHHAADGLGAAGFIAMHRAGDDQPRPRPQRLVAVAGEARRPGRVHFSHTSSKSNEPFGFMMKPCTLARNGI